MRNVKCGCDRTLSRTQLIQFPHLENLLFNDGRLRDKIGSHVRLSEETIVRVDSGLGHEIAGLVGFPVSLSNEDAEFNLIMTSIDMSKLFRDNTVNIKIIVDVTIEDVALLNTGGVMHKVIGPDGEEVRFFRSSVPLDFAGLKCEAGDWVVIDIDDEARVLCHEQFMSIFGKMLSEYAIPEEMYNVETK